MNQTIQELQHLHESRQRQQQDEPGQKSPLGDALERLAETLARRSAEFEAELDAAPLEGICQIHGCGQTLNRARSEENGKLAYDCPECTAAAKAAEIARRQSVAQIPTDIRHARFSNFNDKATPADNSKTPRQFAERFASLYRGEIRNLIVSGTPGIGKGHLAACVCNHRILKGVRGIHWVTAPNAFSAYHRAYNDNATADYIRYLVSRSLLVLDECALRELPKDGEQILFEIFDGRQKAGAQSILLSNAVKAELYAWLGERVIDRLRSGGGDFLWGEWESKRGTNLDAANSI